MDSKKLLRDIFDAAVKAVNPYNAVRSFIEDHFGRWSKGVYVVGFGKAASQMGMACEDVLGGKLLGGYLITKYGHGKKTGMLTLKEAAHPVPDENSIKYTSELVDFVDNLTSDDDLICLISGGGSSLFCKPYEGLTLIDKQITTDMLLRAGADIFELNAVRKHLSDVKGGRFLYHFRGRNIASLILSDVMGDRLDVIASGPTTYDDSTFSEAVDVVYKYGLESSIPRNVREVLRNGSEGVIQETLKKGDPILDKVENTIIGSLSVAIKAAEEKARDAGMSVLVYDEFITGEAVDAGVSIGARVREMIKKRDERPLCIISGGETTVTVKGNGKGGRNMELAAGFAKEVKGLENITMLSAGTDGNDGPTDAAGAIVDGNTISRARLSGLDVDEYLGKNDMYHFFRKEGGLFVTGPTGTNVMDIQIVIIK